MKTLIQFLMIFLLSININCSKDQDPVATTVDVDLDGIIDSVDNCPALENPLQEDQDADGIGDLCDEDVDGDGVNNSSDNCPTTANPDQLDFNENGTGDKCDEDHVFNRLSNPESIVRYKDYYLVSNLGAQLLTDTKDGDGFISVINLDGTGLIEKYISGLDSPKGMKIINDLLYVCDLSEVKVFNIETKEMTQSFSFQQEGVTLINDISDLHTDSKTVFLTATRSKKIFKLDIESGAKEELTVNGVTLLQTNGIALDSDSNLLYVVEWGQSSGSGARIIRIDLNSNNDATILGGTSTGSLYDGVIILNSTLYVSDWSHRLFSLDLNNSNDTPMELLSNLKGPTDIFYDSQTNKIVIPQMSGDSVDFYDIP